MLRAIASARSTSPTLATAGATAVSARLQLLLFDRVRLQLLLFDRVRLGCGLDGQPGRRAPL
jgi:hypothetical protein